MSGLRYLSRYWLLSWAIRVSSSIWSRPLKYSDSITPYLFTRHSLFMVSSRLRNRWKCGWQEGCANEVHSLVGSEIYSDLFEVVSLIEMGVPISSLGSSS